MDIQTLLKEHKEFAQAYASNKEYFVQEAVYYCLPKFWLRNVSPSVIYTNIKIPENRFKIWFPNKKLANYQMKMKIFLRRICLIGIWICQMKSFKIENLLYWTFHIILNSLDNAMFVLYLMKMISRLWNLLMTY